MDELFQQQINTIQGQLQKILDNNRYEHTIGVMYTAACLAMAHGYSIKQAMLAGLLHDCAKCMTHEARIELCNINHVPITESEERNTSLLHAKAGAILAQKEYNITDEEILHAIQVHTTGEPDMSILDKIIYIADYIEPGRNQVPNLDRIRKLAYISLDACVAEISYATLAYLQTKSYTIDPTTELTYQFYKTYRKELD